MSSNKLTGSLFVLTLAKVAFPLAVLAAAHSTHRRRAGSAGGDAPPWDPADVWHTKTVCGLRRTEELLDRLEHCGSRERDVRILDDSTFLVRWR